MNIISKKTFNYMLIRNYCVPKFCVGDFVEISKKITRDDIADFSRLTGDTNPIHSGDHGIVHGAYLNGLVSGVIGTKLPGSGTLVVSQNLRFPNKCFVGDLVTVRVQLTAVRKIVRVEYKCTVGESTVLEGDAKLIPAKTS